MRPDMQRELLTMAIEPLKAWLKMAAIEKIKRQPFYGRTITSGVVLKWKVTNRYQD